MTLTVTFKLLGENVFFNKQISGTLKIVGAGTTTPLYGNRSHKKKMLLSETQIPPPGRDIP